MTLPYSSATSGKKAMQDLESFLREFGIQSFGSFLDFEIGELRVQFKYQGRVVDVRASMNGYAQAWLRENPWTRKRKSTEQDWIAKANEIASYAVYSMIRDWMKGQITAIETGLMSFDAAFMPHIMLPNGSRMLDHVNQQNLLPAPTESQ